MTKAFLKEIIIILLLCVVIVLILGIVLYDYNPINKVVPNKVAYTVPDNIKNELEESKTQNAIPRVAGIVYTIEGTDLNNYQESNSYDPSKENPFVDTPTGEVYIDNDNTPKGNTANSGTSSGQTSTTNQNTTNNQATSSTNTGNNNSSQTASNTSTSKLK